MSKPMTKSSKTTEKDDTKGQRINSTKRKKQLYDVGINTEKENSIKSNNKKKTIMKNKCVDGASSSKESVNKPIRSKTINSMGNYSNAKSQHLPDKAHKRDKEIDKQQSNARPTTKPMRSRSNDYSSKDTLRMSSKEKSKLIKGKYIENRKSIYKDIDNIDFLDIEKKIFEGIPDSNKLIENNEVMKQKTNIKDEKNSKYFDKKEKKTSNTESRNIKNSSKNKVKKDIESSNRHSSRNTVKKEIMQENTESSKKHLSKNKVKTQEDSSSEGEFEEEDEFQQILALNTEENQGVKIEVESTNVMWGLKKRVKKSEEDMVKEYLRKQYNRCLKDVQENMHKVHVQCLLMHGYYLNKTTNSETVMAAALSIITTKNLYPSKRIDLSHIERIMKWFNNHVKASDKVVDSLNVFIESRLISCFERKMYSYKNEQVLMFLTMLKVLGAKSRLIMALHAMTWRVSADKLLKPKKLDDTNEGSSTDQPKRDVVTNEDFSADQIKVKPKSRKVISPSVDRSQPSTSKKRKYQFSDDDDSDFDTKNYKSSRTASSKGKKKLSTDKAKIVEEKKLKEKFTFWVEVYAEEEEQWISVDVSDNKIHCVSEDIKKKLPGSIGYIVGFNSDLSVKDVTQRYILNWLSYKKKLRLDDDWWLEALKPIRGAITKEDLFEEKSMRKVLHEQPFPKSISEFKNHPLYALQRHQLKFEGIYPPDICPIGYIRGEPIYPRENVYALHGREKWIKEGKTVKVGEEPYKTVKANPKWDKLNFKIIKGDDRAPLELFGHWQTEDFVPPIAKNGKVPRNEYGNVELFKPTMMPKGCVYIDLFNINRVARKLGIDCAPALIRFDFHKGFSHPVFEGYVICEEFKDILMDAWTQEQELAAKREEDKRLKRIYDKWKKLIRGMLIKEDIEKKYGGVLKQEAEEKLSKRKKQTEKKSKQVSQSKQPKKDENKKEKKKMEETKKKITQEDINNAAQFSKAKNILKVDLNSHVSQIYEDKMKSIAKSLDDSTDEETDEQKTEKLQNILKMDLDTGCLPNLSDSEDEAQEKSVKPLEPQPILPTDFYQDNFNKSKSTKKYKVRESLQSILPTKSAKKSCTKRISSNKNSESEEISGGDETSSDSDFEVVQPKTRSRRKSAKVSYRGDESDADFSNSDEDKSYEPERKKKKSN